MLAADSSPDYGALLAKLEARADMAEKKLGELETEMKKDGKRQASPDVAQLTKSYVADLTELRAIMVRAETEYNALKSEVAELQQMKSKLEYQVQHLKKHVV
eukprot:jgi/Picsp_1/6669/NSC_04012-R1_predicted protein [Physcomitrella patens subsp. patens]